MHAPFTLHIEQTKMTSKFVHALWSDTFEKNIVNCIALHIKR